MPAEPRYSAKIICGSGSGKRLQTIGVFDDKETAARAFDVRFVSSAEDLPHPP
eukprot:SAG11_NODE_26286_length_347_cov_0.826613_1_plen_53_part_00